MIGSDLVRLTRYRDPEDLAQQMFRHLNSDPDEAVVASHWFREMASELEELGRGG